MIERSEVVRIERQKRRAHRSIVEYSFTVDGGQHRSERVTLSGGLRGTSKSSAQQRCAQYPVGKRVVVYYDPTDPASCCLERRAESISVLRWVALAAWCLAATAQMGLLSF